MDTKVLTARWRRWGGDRPLGRCHPLYRPIKFLAEPSQARIFLSRLSALPSCALFLCPSLSVSLRHLQPSCTANSLLMSPWRDQTAQLPIYLCTLQYPLYLALTPNAVDSLEHGYQPNCQRHSSQLHFICTTSAEVNTNRLANHLYNHSIYRIFPPTVLSSSGKLDNVLCSILAWMQLVDKKCSYRQFFIFYIYIVTLDRQDLRYFSHQPYNGDKLLTNECSYYVILLQMRNYKSYINMDMVNQAGGCYLAALNKVTCFSDILQAGPCSPKKLPSSWRFFVKGSLVGE